MKRLEVLLSEAEFDEIRKFAQGQRLSVVEWVRQALREARERQPRRDKEYKLGVIRDAAKLNHPTNDIDQTLAEIERGYLE